MNNNGMYNCTFSQAASKGKKSTVNKIFDVISFVDAKLERFICSEMK